MRVYIIKLIYMQCKIYSHTYPIKTCHVDICKYVL